MNASPMRSWLFAPPRRRMHRRRPQQRAVIELFTSQGCSSCPAADKLLGELAADPSLVAISVPIDYWDYLGWKDTLADPRNTARQKAYAHARGDGQVYTPQVVVNGSLHVLGSDKAAIEHAIAKSRKHGAMSLPPVTLALADGRASTVRRSRHGRRAESRGRRGGLAVRAGQGGHRRDRHAARTRDARSPTTTSCGAGSSSAIGPARPIRGASRCRRSRATASTRRPSWCRAARRKSRKRSWALRSPRSGRRHEATSAFIGHRIVAKKRAGCSRPESDWGLNRTRNS